MADYRRIPWAYGGPLDGERIILGYPYQYNYLVPITPDGLDMLTCLPDDVDTTVDFKVYSYTRERIGTRDGQIDVEVMIGEDVSEEQRQKIVDAYLRPQVGCL